MGYIGVLNNLKKSINEKHLSLLFLQSIKELKNSFGVNVSTKFLRGLSNLKDTRKKTKRISYLLRINKLKTIRETNIIKVRGINSYCAVIITWGHDEKNKPFPEVVGLTDNEKRQIKEIRNLSEEIGIDLFNHAEAEHSDRQKTRNAINYGGGAVVRDVKVVKVGNFAVLKRSEILRVVIF